MFKRILQLALNLFVPNELFPAIPNVVNDTDII